MYKVENLQKAIEMMLDKVDNNMEKPIKSLTLAGTHQPNTKL